MTIFLENIFNEFPKLNEFKENISINKFHSVIEVNFELNNNISIKFKIKDSIINRTFIIVKNNKPTETFNFLKNVIKEETLINITSLINIFKADSIEISADYKEFKKDPEIVLILINEEYKILISNEKYCNLSIYSYKDKDIVAEKCKLSYIHTIQDFFNNIEFKVNKELKEYIKSDKLENFNQLIDYCFNDIKKIKNLEMIMRY